MPWKPADATRHNKAATGKRGRQWSDIANSGLKRGLSEGEAIREANGVLKRERRSTKQARMRRDYARMGD